MPSRRSDRCTWSARQRRRDGKGAWCQVRPARRRVHEWAMPTRSSVDRNGAMNGAFQPLS
eukprot:7385836-Prymnesium_polylepis.1